jgi:uncharacterized protein YxeA
MDAAYLRDLMIIILFALIIILIIGGSIAAFIIYRRVNQRVQTAVHSVQNTVDTAQRPIRFAEKVIAYVRGGSRGFVEAINILIGREVKHEHQTSHR